MARSERAAIHRRGVLRLGLAGLVLPLAGCGEKGWYGKDVTGLLPDLSFELTRAVDGAEVTQSDYRGQTVALFFGYTFCPDICPMTMANLTAVAERLQGKSQELTILFVTVDPERDTRQMLVEYSAAFGPRSVALRGTENQLVRLARRYKTTYKIAAHAPGAKDYAVSHGKSVYVFDEEGEARLLWPEFDTAEADIAGAVSDVQRLIGGV